MSGDSGSETFAVTLEGRRRWSSSEKLAIVAEIATSTVSAVARKHGIASSLLFRWRRELGEAAAPDGFVQLSLPPPSSSLPGADTDSRTDGGSIEIILAGHRRVIVGPGVDSATLKRVIAVLEQP